MPSCPRSEIFEPNEISTYKIISRVVRRGHLCGVDHDTGKDYSHRKQWFADRLRQMESVFLVDLLAYTFMDNHFHTDLRNRPDLAKKLSDYEVARRSLMLSSRTMADGVEPREPEEEEIEEVLKDLEKVAKWRDRLSHISWFMRYLKEPIARRANAEDEVTGHFWEGRFRSTRLLDETAVALGMVYVELNEIRAKVSDSPETSFNSSIFQRIKSWERQYKRKLRSMSELEAKKFDTRGREPSPEWLAPINQNSDNGTRSGTMTEEQPNRYGKRPSNSGCLPFTVEQFFNLVDWAGRAVRKGKRGKIPDNLEPILTRLTANHDGFLTAAMNFQRFFKRFCGTPKSLELHGKMKGLKKIHGLPASKAFLTAPS